MTNDIIVDIPVVELTRVEESFVWGTFGYLKINKQAFCVTLEPPDKENARNVSSIPAQQYICRRIMSITYGETFEVSEVPGRDQILMHPGNVVEHTKGCIILGQYWGKLGQQRAALNSGNTFREFMRIMSEHQQFILTIKEDF